MDNDGNVVYFAPLVDTCQCEFFDQLQLGEVKQSLSWLDSVKLRPFGLAGTEIY